MQTSSQLIPPSFLTTLRGLVQREGATALWRGALPAFSSAAVENAVVFTANGFFRRQLADGLPESSLSLPQHAVIGGLSGVLSATAICPAEVVKCRLQYLVKASPAASASPLACVVDIYRQAGVRGFFSGLPALLMRDVPFNALFFGSYRTFCRLCAFARMQNGWGRHGSSDDKLGGTAVARVTHEHLSPAEYFVCGGFAGMAAWSVIFPFDSVKSRMQSGSVSTGVVTTIRDMWAKGGAAPFFRGWSAAVLRAFPANAALFLGVETSRKLFKSLT